MIGQTLIVVPTDTAMESAERLDDSMVGPRPAKRAHAEHCLHTGSAHPRPGDARDSTIDVISSLRIVAARRWVERRVAGVMGRTTDHTDPFSPPPLDI